MSAAPETSVAHLGDWQAKRFYPPDGASLWHPAQPPDINSEHHTTGRLRSCSYCGSMHPADVAAAIRAGAKGHWADWKYGWPHKAYFDSVPNPHAGMLEVRGWSGNKTETFSREVRSPRYDERTGQRMEDKVSYTLEPEPAKATERGKFYTVHLQDASPEDRATIEAHLGLAFEFAEDGRVSWSKVAGASPGASS